MTNEEALRRFRDVCRMCGGVDCDECKSKNAIDALEWHKGHPIKNGKYLVKEKFFTENDYYTTILSWSNNLYDIDEYDFEDYKNKCGWYEHDIDYGYYNIDDEYIVEWKNIV